MAEYIDRENRQRLGNPWQAPPAGLAVPTHRRRGANLRQRATLIVCAVLILQMAFVPRARADGGAPNLAYVAGSKQGISIIDVARQKVVGNLSVQGNPHTILLSMDGRFLYVTQPQLGKIAILAAKTGESMCSASVAGDPSTLALDQSNNTLYAAGRKASTVTAIDATTCEVKRTFEAGGGVQGVAIALNTGLTGSKGNQIWVAAGNALVIFDEDTGKKIGSVAVPGGPEHITIPPGSTAYVTTQKGSVIAVGLSQHDQVSLVAGGRYGSMDYDAATGQIYVPDQQHRQLLILTPVIPGDPVTHEPSRTIALNAPPASVAITSDGQLGFVAMPDGNITMLDIPAHQVINTFHVGGSPNFIITGLYPPPVAIHAQQGTTAAIGSIATALALVVALSIGLFSIYRKSRKYRREAR